VNLCNKKRFIHEKYEKQLTPLNDKQSLLSGKKAYGEARKTM
jgi:hypothetical protein